MKYIEWDESYGTQEKLHIVCRAKEEDVIKYMIETYQRQWKYRPNYPYPNNQSALDDFIAINCARIVEE